MEVIPSLNCHLGENECIKEKVRIAEKFADWIHLDVADGKFTFNKTWGDLAGWRSMNAKVKLEVHLMVEEPEKQVMDWIEAGAERIVVHAETLTPDSAEEIRALGEEHGVEIMLSFLPETNLEFGKEYFKRFSSFQVLSVYAGLPGQSFLPIVLEKIRVLRQNFPKAKIEVDGGINLETAKAAKKAGANILVSASYIFADKDPAEAYRKILAC